MNKEPVPQDRKASDVLTRQPRVNEIWLFTNLYFFFECVYFTERKLAMVCRGSQSTNDTEDQKLMDLLIIEQKVKSVLFCN